MKLKTNLTASRDGSLVDATDENLIHDAGAAHALMMAMDRYGSTFPLSTAAPQDVIQWVGRRASELMAQWGFDSGEDA